MTRKHVARIAVALSVVSMLAAGGCAKDQGDSAAAKEFTYWSMYKEGEPAQKALAASIKDFTAKTGVKVKVQWQGRDVLKKLQPTLNTVPAADLVDRNLKQVKSIMVSSGTAADLGSVLDMPIPGESAKVGDVIPETYLTFGKAGDQLVMVPYNVTPYAIWYDAKRFPDVTAESVKTWDDFEKVLASSKAKGAPLALDSDIGPYNALWYVNFVVNRLGPGALNKAAGDKTGETWNQPGYLEAAKRIESLVKAGYFAKGYDASKFPAIQQKWATGKANFILMGAWLPGEVKPYAAPGADYRSIPFPNDGASGSLAAADGYGWVMPSKARNAEAAKKFIAFMYGKDQVQRFVDETQQIAARSDVKPPASVADAAEMTSGAESVYDSSDGVEADYADWFLKVFTPLMTKLVTGKVDAQSFVNELRDQSTDYWKRNP